MWWELVDMICEGLCAIALFIILVITFPAWVIPYLLYGLWREKKHGY